MTAAVRTPADPRPLAIFATHAFPYCSPVTWADLAAELDRELDLRRRVYPARVAKGSMTQAAATHELALFAAIRADIALQMAEGARLAETRVPRIGALHSAHGESWDDRDAALGRELAMRRRLYPRWIAEGRITAPDAARRVWLLALVRRIYEDGFDHPLTRPAPDEDRAALARDRRAFCQAMAARDRVPLDAPPPLPEEVPAEPMESLL